MKIRKPGRTSQRKAIRAALGRLGWHAGPGDVVALLARYGVEVSEGLVSKVKIETLKRPEDVKRHEQKVKHADKRRRRPTTGKRPPPRTYHR